MTASSTSKLASINTGKLSQAIIQLMDKYQPEVNHSFIKKFNREQLLFVVSLLKTNNTQQWEKEWEKLEEKSTKTFKKIIQIRKNIDSFVLEVKEKKCKKDDLADLKSMEEELGIA